LFKLKRKKEKLYLLYIKNKDDKVLLGNFIAFKAEYSRLYRVKMTKYFESKKSNDFKNSKQFWQFYSKSIKRKSDGKGIGISNGITINGSITNDKNEISNQFVNFFSNLKSNVCINEDDCKSYTFKSSIHLSIII
jgi:hypothetical protein